MLTKEVAKYYALGIGAILVGFALAMVSWSAVAMASSVEKREVLRTETFKIAGGEQKFMAFYLSTPADGFEITWNVSEGSIKFSPWQACIIEDCQGYFDHYVNETTVEKVQVWFFEGNNGTAGASIDSTKDVNQIWYVHFYNEDSYEKEVFLQVTKIWHGLFR